MSALPKPFPEEEPTGYRETPSMILPAAVPPELDAAIDAAWVRAKWLAAGGRGVDFSVGSAGDLQIVLRDRSGRLGRTLSPSQAVNLMGGLGQV